MESARRATIFALGVVPATAGLVFVAAPATAASGTVSGSGNTITFTGSAEAETVAIGGDGNDAIAPDQGPNAVEDGQVRMCT